MKRVPSLLSRASYACRASHCLPAPAAAGYYSPSLLHSSSRQPATRTVVSCTPPMPFFKFLCYSSSAAKAAAPPATSSKLVNHNFLTGICAIPHPSKIKKGGEDAHFVSSNYRVIAVADGVGGWTDVGVDPALYSRALIEGCKLYCSENSNAEAEEMSKAYNPVSIMDAGFNFASKIIGSSTCCICVLDGLKLKVANLGDSGFTIIRGGKVFFSSTPQQHAFNFPYQLGAESLDLPEHAEVFELTLELGDIVVAATDGVFDNVSPETIATLMDENSSASQLAERIGAYAFTQANKRNVDTPFALMAQNQGYSFRGGKLDDITVVVGIVTETPIHDGYI